MIRLFAIGLAALAACGGSGLHDGVFRDGDRTYHLDPLEKGWARANFAGNDLAWTAKEGQVIAVNGTCEDHGDPSLKVLTQHLLLGFEDREPTLQEEMTLDGRGALRTRLTAALDGVPVDLELTVLKKDGCVYDFTYTAPHGRFDEHLGDYQHLVASFKTGKP